MASSSRREGEEKKTARCTRLFLGASHGGEREEERKKKKTEEKRRDEKRRPTDKQTDQNIQSKFPVTDTFDSRITLDDKAP